MKKTGILLFILLFVSSLSFAAQWVEIKKADEPFEVSVTQFTPERTVLNYLVNGYSIDEISINGKTYNLFSKLRKESVIEEKGYPRLPRINRSVLIPDNGIMGYEILSADYIEIQNIDIAPSKGNITRNIDPATVPYTFADVYQKDEFYPAELVNLKNPYIMRDFRGVVVELNAFQYNPVQRILRIYTDVKIEVKKVAAGGENTIQRSVPLTKLNRQFADMYQRHFINYGELDYPTLFEPGEILVICHDSFMSEMQPYVDWKNQKGYPTAMVPVSQAGSTPEAIKAYISNVYQTSDLAYVLLIGDHAQIPTWATGTWGSGPSDPNYSLLEGNDSYPEIFVGRFSAENTAHVATQVERSVDYEKYPEITGDWYHQGLGVASNQGPGHFGEYDNEHITLIAYKLLGYTYTQVDSAYDPWGTVTMVNRNLNEYGISTINYCGHGSTTSWGSTGFDNGDVNALTNSNRLPFITSVACLNGCFTNTTCFAEAWLRATHNSTGEPTGAVAAYMSRISQSWNPPMDMEDEGVDLMIADSMFTFGGLCFNGSMKMIDLNGSMGETEFKAWTIFGDPSLEVRNDTPYYMTVLHGGSHPVGVAQFNVNVEGLSGDMEGALVCAMNDEIYAAAYTNSSGNVTLVFDPAPTSPGSFLITVTGWNAIPYWEEVDLVSPTGAYVIYNDLTINDASGNNNGMLNPGENAFLSITVENVGTLGASNVEVTIDSDDEYITIIDGSENYGNIGSGSTSLVTDGFQVELAANTPAGHGIDFTLTATDGIDTWESTFTIDAIPDVVVSLQPSGTPIQIPGSGGSFDFTIGAENLGGVTAVCDIWTLVTLPNGSPYGPIINVVKTMSPGFSIDRDRTQNVPANAPSGDYVYHAYIGDYPDVIYVQDEFGFEKLGTVNAGELVNDWNNFGEDFGDLTENSAYTAPAKYSLSDAYPNPFNPETTLSFNLPEASQVSLTIYNLYGQIVAALHNGMTPAGYHTFTWNAEGMSSGVYFYHLQAGEFNAVKKCILMK